MRVIKNDSVPPPVCQFHLVCAAPNKCIWQFTHLFYRANFADRGTLLHDMRTDCSVKLTLLPCTRKLPSGLSFLYAQRELNIQTYISFRQTYFLYSACNLCYSSKSVDNLEPNWQKIQPTGQRIFHIWTFFFYYFWFPLTFNQNSELQFKKHIYQQVPIDWLPDCIFWIVILLALYLFCRTDVFPDRDSNQSVILCVLTTGCGAILKSFYLLFPPLCKDTQKCCFPVYDYIVEKPAGFTWTGFKAQAK